MTKTTNTGVSRRWLLHRARLLRGDWHTHTVFTDGKSSVRENCEAARALELQVLALTEHVRRELRYDFSVFTEEVDAARREFPELTILRGCEAKVLSADGDLDVSDDVLAHCDVVLAAFHAFPDPHRYVTAVCNMLTNPHVDIWAHPTLYARKQRLALSPGDVERMVECCRDQGVLLELNGRYRLPGGVFLEAVREAGVTTVFGSDAHHAREVGRRWTGSELERPGDELTFGESLWR